MTASELEQIVELLTSRPTAPTQTPAEMRDGLARLTRRLPVPADAVCEPVDAGGVPAEWIAAPGAAADRQILYLHGGGYVLGSIETHRTLCYGLSRASGARVLSLDYRLAPEHPYPAAVEDALAGWRWMVGDGGGAAGAAVAGDSAGGGLTLATLFAIRDAGLAQPGCALAISPWVDLEGLGESMTAQAPHDPMVQRDRLLVMAGWYLNGADPRTPGAAPLYGALGGLAPLLVQVGTRETLLDDSTRLAARIRESGGTVTLSVWDGMIHVWPLFAPLLSEGRDALAEAGAFIRRHLG